MDMSSKLFDFVRSRKGCKVAVVLLLVLNLVQVLSLIPLIIEGNALAIVKLLVCLAGFWFLVYGFKNVNEARYQNIRTMLIFLMVDLCVEFISIITVVIFAFVYANSNCATSNNQNLCNSLNKESFPYLLVLVTVLYNFKSFLYYCVRSHANKLKDKIIDAPDFISPIIRAPVEAVPTYTAEPQAESKS